MLKQKSAGKSPEKTEMCVPSSCPGALTVTNQISGVVFSHLLELKIDEAGLIITGTVLAQKQDHADSENKYQASEPPVLPDNDIHDRNIPVLAEISKEQYKNHRDCKVKIPGVQTAFIQ